MRRRVSEVLIDFLKTCGKSQTELGPIIGIDRTALSRVLRGERHFTQTQIDRAAHYFRFKLVRRPNSS